MLKTSFWYSVLLWLIILAQLFDITFSLVLYYACKCFHFFPVWSCVLSLLHQVFCVKVMRVTILSLQKINSQYQNLSFSLFWNPLVYYTLIQFCVIGFLSRELYLFEKSIDLDLKNGIGKEVRSKILQELELVRSKCW